jgi:hypothetical protein
LSSAGSRAASPLGFWWLDPATIHALSLPLMGVYTGLTVPGRPAVLAVETGVRGVLVVLALIAVTGSA